MSQHHRYLFICLTTYLPWSYPAIFTKYCFRYTYIKIETHSCQLRHINHEQVLKKLTNCFRNDAISKEKLTKTCNSKFSGFCFFYVFTQSLSSMTWDSHNFQWFTLSYEKFIYFNKFNKLLVIFLLEYNNSLCNDLLKEFCFSFEQFSFINEEEIKILFSFI